eukprot:GHVU01038594.1.p2 GENE.GHVU01038594.1~~GHVU01038594.1.p2  ORF type:complete len:203 (+),score=21.51 GHVU01038594.1:785-1393(+)
MLGRRRAPRSDNADADSSSNADCKEQKGGAAVLQSRLAGHRLLGECGAAGRISDASLPTAGAAVRLCRRAAEHPPWEGSCTTGPAVLILFNMAGRTWKWSAAGTVGGCAAGRTRRCWMVRMKPPRLRCTAGRRTPFLPRAMGPAVDAHPFLTIDIRFVIAVEGTRQAVVGGGRTAAPLRVREEGREGGREGAAPMPMRRVCV